MSEAHSGTLRRREPAAAFDLKKRLEQLARGECSADDFVRESLAGRSRTDGPWDLLSFIDQRYRLGQIPDELFQSIKSRIAWRELQDKTFGTTVELVPIAPATPAAPASARSAAPSPANVPAARTVVRDAADSAPGSALSVAAPVVLELQDAQALAGPPLASAPVLVEALRPGRVLCDRYVIENCLGDGGMGTVYRAIDRHASLPVAANRRVALKVLRERLGPRPAVLVQLRREFHCTQSLSHPNVVKVYELDCDGDIGFYTMELLDGEPLHALLARTRPAGLPRPYAWSIIRAVGSAIAHAHARNVIHGDLKPQNVMITQSGEVRVLDFGSSRNSSDVMPAGEGRMPLTATPLYASCDVLERDQPDPRDDLYSLACVTYELLAGAHPFGKRSSLEARAADERPRRPAGLSGRAWRTLRAGLSFTRAKRSIPVSDWLMQLGLDLEPQRLPEFSAPARHRSWREWPWRDFALPLVAVATAALIWMGAPGHRTLAPMSAPSSPAPRMTEHAPAAAPPLAPAPAVAPPVAVGARAPAAAAPASTGGARPDGRNDRNAATRRAIERPAPAEPRIWLSARSRRVPRGANFAEVRVRRSEGAGSFLWWTEDGTARAGSDYIAQARILQTFSKGRDSATLFVRLRPEASRAAPASFQLIIEPATPAALGGPARTSIVLPATR